MFIGLDFFLILVIKSGIPEPHQDQFSSVGLHVLIIEPRYLPNSSAGFDGGPG